MAVPKVDRSQVVAFRVAAQGLHRETSAVGDLAVLDIGVQEAMGQPAAVIWAARLDAPVAPDTVAVGPGHRLAMTWSLTMMGPCVRSDEALGNGRLPRLVETRN